jgi:CRISPR-associated DxTHG motif protein
MKLLTFIGVNNYNETTYRWQEHTYRSRFVAEALAEWFTAESVVVFLTAQAKQHANWQEFQQRVQHRHLVPVDIPDVNGEQDMWRIFDQVVKQVQEGEHIALDITHAFRFLPMLILTVGAFLRVTKNVQIEHIFYGQYVPGQAESPVIDMVLLLSLLDWAAATQRLRETGDARWIGRTLKDTHRELWKTRAAQPSALYQAGKDLETLSQALHLARSQEAMKAAESLRKNLEGAPDEIAEWAKPFALLLEEVKEQTEHLAHSDTDTLDAKHLRKQLYFIGQLVEYGLTLQAAQMAREWVVNWAIWYREGCGTLQKEQWLGQDVRQKVEDELNKAFPSTKQHRDPAPLKWLENSKMNDLLKQLWSDVLPDLRNDLAHCGMRTNPRSLQALQKQTEQYLSQLQELIHLSSSD